MSNITKIKDKETGVIYPIEDSEAREDISELKSAIGDLNDLDVEANTDIVSAINEVAQNGGGGISGSASALLITILREGLYKTDQSANITSLSTLLALKVISISATFNQGTNVIYDTDSLDTLRQYLTVTATYDDGTAEETNGYILSGALTAGTSTITVSMGGKRTTISVNVTEMPKYSITYNLTNVTSSNTQTVIMQGGTYETTISYDEENYTFGGVTITMGGTDITSSAYSETGIKINEVTGNVVITATANERVINETAVIAIGTRSTFYSDEGTTQLASPLYGNGIASKTITNRDCTATVTFINNTENNITGGKYYAGSLLNAFNNNTTIPVYYAIEVTVPTLTAGRSFSFQVPVKKWSELFVRIPSTDLTIIVEGLSEYDPEDIMSELTSIPYTTTNQVTHRYFFSDGGETQYADRVYNALNVSDEAFESDTDVVIYLEATGSPSNNMDGGSYLPATTGSDNVWYAKAVTNTNTSTSACNFAITQLTVKAGFKLAVTYGAGYKYVIKKA